MKPSRHHDYHNGDSRRGGEPPCCDGLYAIGTRIQATAGDLGHVRDVYFDDAPLHEYFQWPFGSSEWVSEDVELAVALQKVLIETRGNAVTARLREQTDDPRLWSARALSRYGVEGRMATSAVSTTSWCFRT